MRGVSGAAWTKKARGLLLNAMEKRAWSESVGVTSFDPRDLAEELRLAISDVIEAVDDRTTMASILLDLYLTEGGSVSEAVSMLFQASQWTGSSAVHNACEVAVRRGGPDVIDFLVDAFRDASDVDGAVDFIFDLCRALVKAIRDKSARVGALRMVYREALNATDDAGITRALREGLKVAAQEDEDKASETLLHYYHRNAVWGTDDDPWPFLDALIQTLQATGAQGQTSSHEGYGDMLERSLREAMATEDPDVLWDGYQ